MTYTSQALPHQVLQLGLSSEMAAEQIAEEARLHLLHKYPTALLSSANIELGELFPFFYNVEDTDFGVHEIDGWADAFSGELAEEMNPSKFCFASAYAQRNVMLLQDTLRRADWLAEELLEDYADILRYYELDVLPFDLYQPHISKIVGRCSPFMASLEEVVRKSSIEVAGVLRVRGA